MFIALLKAGHASYFHTVAIFTELRAVARNKFFIVNFIENSEYGIRNTLEIYLALKFVAINFNRLDLLQYYNYSYFRKPIIQILSNNICVCVS